VNRVPCRRGYFIALKKEMNRKALLISSIPQMLLIVSGLVVFFYTPHKMLGECLIFMNIGVILDRLVKVLHEGELNTGTST